MEKSLEDLLSDAFSETSVPSFPEDEELDFESLDFKDDGTILSHSNSTVEQEDVSPLTETASTSAFHNERRILDAKNNSQECYSSSEEGFEENDAEIDELGDFVYNIPCSKQDNMGLNQNQCIVDQEDIAPIPENLSADALKEDQERLLAKNIQDVEASARPEDCTSSEDESLEGESKIELKAGDFVETVHCGSDNEQVFAMGPDLGQKDKDQNSNQEDDETEKQYYFKSIRRSEGDLKMQDDTSEEEDEVKSTKTTFFQVEYTLEYPEIPYDGVEELTDELVDKMEDFSGDEHQEAGESFAEYPSDFSSCEYVDDARNAQECDLESQLDCLAHNDLETTSQKGIEEVETEDRFLNNKPKIDSIGENDTDEDRELSNKHEMGLLEMTQQDLCFMLPKTKDQDNDVLQSWTEDVFSACSNSGSDTRSSNADNTGHVELASDRCMPHMKGEEEEDLTAVFSSRGSVDDSFFFTDEPKVFDAMEEQMEEDDEEEEKRKEQERIQAFYRFYDDEGDRHGEERQIKVQFCMETLSQVIHYDTDSTERESLSSSSDEGEKDSDQNPEQTFELETPSLGPNEEYASLSQEAQKDTDHTQKDLPTLPEIINPESINKPICNKKHKCLPVLKLILSLFLTVVLGLVMFWWWITDAEEWPDFVL